MISLEMISCPGITKKRRSEERKEKEKKSIEVGPNRDTLQYEPFQKPFNLTCISINLTLMVS